MPPTERRREGPSRPFCSAVCFVVGLLGAFSSSTAKHRASGTLLAHYGTSQPVCLARWSVGGCSPWFCNLERSCLVLLPGTGQSFLPVVSESGNWPVFCPKGNSQGIGAKGSGVRCQISDLLPNLLCGEAERGSCGAVSVAVPGTECPVSKRRPLPQAGLPRRHVHWWPDCFPSL